jgi:hypothetical protein
VFQLGETGSLGICTWGRGGLPLTSYRTLIAKFADSIKDRPTLPVAEVAKQWSGLFWPLFSSQLAVPIADLVKLKAIANPTKEEEGKAAAPMQVTSVGFCIGGWALPDRTPCAFTVDFDGTLTAAPAPVALPMDSWTFRGFPNIFGRMFNGIDPGIPNAIAQSKHWKGTDADLKAIISQFKYGPRVVLPIREAIDYIHASIYTTIKAIKFSPLPPICGGPIEIAVITTDRPFRWVRHKGLDAAISHD